LGEGVKGGANKTKRFGKDLNQDDDLKKRGKKSPWSTIGGSIQEDIFFAVAEWCH